MSRSTARCRKRSSGRRWRTSTTSTSSSGRRRRSASSGPPASARPSRSSTRSPTRSSRPSGCASSRPRSTPACEFRLEVEVGSMPLYVYKAVEEFRRRWRTRCGDAAPGSLRMAGHRLHGHHDRLRLPSHSRSHEASAARRLPAADAAGPDGRAEAGRHRGVRADAPLPARDPADTFGATASALARLRAVPQTQEMRGSSYVLEGEIPAARVHELQQQLPALTRGEGVLESAFDSLPAGRRRAPRPGRGRTTTRSTAKSTCCTSRGGSDAQGRSP